ncbi:MAG: glycine--tRNA ligase subunit beta [Nitrospira sp.]|nr:glycine--tRNA ligase subunit beta [Nitrospira sp.]
MARKRPRLGRSVRSVEPDFMDNPKKTVRRSVASKSQKPSPAPAVEDLLIEVGVEELPSQFIAPALAAMKESSERLLKDQRLAFRAIRMMGTPRRLTMVVEGLAVRQAGVVKETMGPPKAAAFDQAGQPTRAAIGFASTHGVPVQNLEVRRTPKGEYLFAVKHEAGQPASSVLLRVLPNLVTGLAFPKSMKWNESGVRFARPIRWLLAIYGGAVLPFDVAGVTASNQTTGHRVVGGGKWIRVKDAASYEVLMERYGVIVDPQRRRHLIQQQIDEICRKTGFELNEDEMLLDQAVYSTELPTVLIGSFKEIYLDVPEEILMTSMKEHQGFFSLRRKETGKLAPHFIAVVNTRVTDMSLIRTGNERVLEARLADAKFFFDEDRKVRLSERIPKLSGVTFHQKLGTMAQKQERVKHLAGFIAGHLSSGHNDLLSICERAASLAKADLVTGIVGEFPELQGIMGGVYALHDGEPPEVARAIREQYLPKGIEGEAPRTLAGQVLALADRLDSIAAFFHVGLVPTGSEDPFALRRQATAVVRIILEANLQADLATFVKRARQLVSDDGFKGLADSESHGVSRIIEFILERVRHYCRVAYLLRDDVVEAVLKSLGDRPLDLVDLVRKMKALEAVTRKPEFDALLIGFKRAHRLVEKEQWIREAVDPSRFQHAAESDLYRAVTDARTHIKESIAAGRYDRTLDALTGLKPSIDEFFSAVMVNVDDPAVRRNRLSLLKDVDELFASFADFSQIVVQGG